MNQPPVKGAEALAAARNALSLGASLALTGSLALLVRLMIPRLLGPGAFGEYRLAEAAAEMLFVVLTFGVDAHLRREAALSPSQARGYLFGLTVLRLGLGVVGGAAALAFLHATGASAATRQLFLVIAAAQVLLVLNNTYAAFEHASGDVRWIARNNLTMKVLWALALTAVLLLTPVGVAVAMAALAVEALRFAWLTTRGVRRHDIAVRPDVPLAITAVLASLPFFVNVVAHSLYARIETGWLAALATDAELGLHGAASNLASIALLGMPLLSWVLVPSAARAAASSAEELTRLVSNALRVSLLVIVPVALAFFVSPEFWLRLFFGASFEAAAPVLRILAPTFAMAYASTVCAISVIQRGRVWTVAGISLAGVVFTMLADMVLVPWGLANLGRAGGAQGAAWATLATETLVTAALAWASREWLRDAALARTAASIGAAVALAVFVASLSPATGVAVSLLASAVFLLGVIATRGIDIDDLRFCRRAIGRGPRRDGGAALLTVALVVALGARPAGADAPHRPDSAPTAVRGATPVAAPGYVVGLDDVLEIAYWREKELSAEVVVRPDGKIALPLIGDVDALGLTPAELTDRVKALARELLEFPVLTVSVKQINSRNVVITGEVTKPGRYPLAGPTTVVELIAMAGGLSEFADQKNIGVLRTVNGTPTSFKVNYKNLSRLKDLHENIALQPGDIVVVP